MTSSMTEAQHRRALAVVLMSMRNLGGDHTCKQIADRERMKEEDVHWLLRSLEASGKATSVQWERQDTVWWRAVEPEKSSKL